MPSEDGDLLTFRSYRTGTSRRHRRMGRSLSTTFKSSSRPRTPSRCLEQEKHRQVPLRSTVSILYQHDTMATCRSMASEALGCPRPSVAEGMNLSPRVPPLIVDPMMLMRHPGRLARVNSTNGDSTLNHIRTLPLILLHPHLPQLPLAILHHPARRPRSLRPLLHKLRQQSVLSPHVLLLSLPPPHPLRPHKHQLRRQPRIRWSTYTIHLTGAPQTRSGHQGIASMVSVPTDHKRHEVRITICSSPLLHCQPDPPSEFMSTHSAESKFML